VGSVAANTMTMGGESIMREIGPGDGMG